MKSMLFDTESFAAPGVEEAPEAEAVETAVDTAPEESSLISESEKAD